MFQPWIFFLKKEKEKGNNKYMQQWVNHHFVKLEQSVWIKGVKKIYLKVLILLYDLHATGD